MPIRKMNLEDVQEVSSIVIESFLESVAHSLSQEGISTFMKLAAPEAFEQRMKEDNHMFVYSDHGEIVAMIELKKGQHVAMLFVVPRKQGRGIGRKLLQEALRHRRVQVVTVSASLPSIPAYKKYGFKVSGREREQQGLRFIPMTYSIDL